MKFSRKRFSAIRTPDIDGIERASKGEANFVSALRLRERAGQIADLQTQPEFRIEINGKWVCTVKADASFVENGEHHVQDYKGIEGDTPVSRLKRKLVKAAYGIEIEIVGPAMKKARRSAKAKAKKATHENRSGAYSHSLRSAPGLPRALGKST